VRKTHKEEFPTFPFSIFYPHVQWHFGQLEELGVIQKYVTTERKIKAGVLYNLGSVNLEFLSSLVTP